MHHEEQSELLFHVVPLSVRLPTAQSPTSANHQRSKKTTVQILNTNKWTYGSQLKTHSRDNTTVLQYVLWLYVEVMYFYEINAGVVGIRDALRI